MPKKPQTQSLGDLRRSRAFTQNKLARAMRTSQSEVSKLEQRRDTYVSTLRAYVKALGGELALVARFRDADIHIGQFGPKPRK
jgi:transcriptional regulator with XRE-family HTH domain